MADQPRLIRLHPADNVSVVANDGGLPNGTEVDGLTLTEAVPQAHKVALTDLGTGDPVLRYGTVIGYAAEPIPKGAWVKESNLEMPSPPVLSELAMPSGAPAELSSLEGYSFQGFRNPDGTVGTRNILAITNTVQCVSGVVGHAVGRSGGKSFQVPERRRCRVP